MKVLVYATDLRDREWKKLARLLPREKTGGRPRKHPWRLICNTIFPPWKRVYHHFRAWRLAGVWLRLHERLRSLCRRRAGRSTRPTAAIIDSQSAKDYFARRHPRLRRWQEGRRAPASPPCR